MTALIHPAAGLGECESCGERHTGCIEHHGPNDGLSPCSRRSGPGDMCAFHRGAFERGNLRWQKAERREAAAQRRANRQREQDAVQNFVERATEEQRESSVFPVPSFRSGVAMEAARKAGTVHRTARTDHRDRS